MLPRPSFLSCNIEKNAIFSYTKSGDIMTIFLILSFSSMLLVTDDGCSWFIFYYIMMIYEGIKEIETEGSEHVAIRIPSSNLIQTIANILTDISGERLTTKRISAMLYKTLMFNNCTPITESVDELENDTSLTRKVKEMLKEAESFYFIYGTPVFKEVNSFITTITMQYYLVSVFRDGSSFTINIAKIKHYKAEEGRKGYGRIIIQ